MHKKIVINFPSNLGDVILALPVLDKVKASYPDAKISAITAPRTRDFLSRNNFIDEIIFFDKQWKMLRKVKFAFSLRGKFDLMVDLKNSFLPVILGVRVRTPFMRSFPKNMHIKDKHLAVIKNIAKTDTNIKSDFSLKEAEKNRLSKLKIPLSLFLGCSSLSAIKTYPYECLRKVVGPVALKHPVVIVGQKKDREYYKDILSFKGVIDLVGKTTMVELFYLLKNYAHLVLAVDSSILHLGSYLDIPSIAFFGPTHPDRSRPYSKHNLILRKNELSCIPCEGTKCDINHECMKIDPKKVINAIEELW